MNVAGHNLYLKGQYGDLDSSCISYGPCQTPTLGFCVSRHDQISSFKPEKYWRISLSVKTKFGSIATEWSRGRIFDNGVANLFFNRVKKGKGKFLLLYLYFANHLWRFLRCNNQFNFKKGKSENSTPSIEYRWVTSSMQCQIGNRSSTSNERCRASVHTRLESVI